MSDTRDEASKLGIDPSGYADTDEANERLQRRVEQVRAEQEAVAGNQPRTEDDTSGPVDTSDTAPRNRAPTGNDEAVNTVESTDNAQSNDNGNKRSARRSNKG